METFEINGKGTFFVANGMVQISFPEIRKENKLKRFDLFIFVLSEKN